MRMKHKSWSEPFINEHSDIVKVIKDKNDFAFLHNREYVLEIGTGRGDFILQMAQKFKDKLWIGIEMNVDALAMTAKKIVENQLTNVILIRQNFAFVAPLLPPGLCTTIYLNFSDPWPKARHEKRRLTSNNFLREYKDILKDDGQIIMKTDNCELFEYSIWNIGFDKYFKVVETDDNYQLDAATDAMSEYERKFRNLGQPIYRMIIKRRTQ